MKFAETYEEVKAYQGTSVRNTLRSVALDVASPLFRKRHDVDELLRKKRIQFLYIHHIFRDEENLLRALLINLQKSHVFISYSEAVRRIQEGDIDQPYICVSSDDGLQNNLQAGRILKEFGISACFFICPSIIGEADEEKVFEFSKYRLNFPAVEYLNWEEVHQLLFMGHEIGGHTMNHVNLAKTTGDELKYELGECFSIIRKQCGISPHFAYPYGRFFHITNAARKKVMDIGYLSCATAERGCHVRQSTNSLPAGDLFIRRDHVLLTWPWEHVEYFMAKNSLRATEQTNYYPPDADRYSDRKS